MTLPEKLQWLECCKHPSCERMYPTNFGTFSLGTGFDPEERKAMDEACSLRTQRDELLAACAQAAEWFEEYAEHHRQLASAAGHHVGKERHAKANRNAQRASHLRALIARIENPVMDGE